MKETNPQTALIQSALDVVAALQWLSAAAASGDPDAIRRAMSALGQHHAELVAAHDRYLNPTGSERIAMLETHLHDAYCEARALADDRYATIAAAIADVMHKLPGGQA